MMKSYTDIEQSKKLAEILPIESADMAWCNSSIKGINYIDPWHAELKTPIEIETIFNEAFVSDWKTWWSIIPCWSLATLLNILSNRAYSIDEDADVILSSYKDVKWDLSISNSGLEAATKSDPIDACVEMIIKLHEQKLL